MDNQLEQFKKEGHKTLKKIFQNQINVNFMIQIMYEVFEKLPNYSDYFVPFDYTIESAIKLEHDHAPFYEVCYHIVYIHRSNVMFLNEEERKKLETSKEYHQSLVDKVIHQIKLRGHTQALLLRKPLTEGDRFIYTPMLYDLTVLLSQCSIYLESLRNHLFYYFFFSIYVEAITTVSLMNDNLYSGAYHHARLLFESTIKYCVLMDNQNALNAFTRLSELDVYRNSEKKNNKEIRTLFDKRVNKTDKSLSNYLHFGWVDEISNYHELVKDKPYSIEGLLKYLEITSDKNYSKLLEYYKRCHGYVHGSNLGSKYPLYNYFELTIILANTVTILYESMVRLLNKSPNIDGIDIVTDFNHEYQKFVHLFESATIDKYSQYYKKYFPRESE